MSDPAELIKPGESRDGNGDGTRDGRGLARRRFLQLAGSTMIGGVALSILNACSSSTTTRSVTVGTTSPTADSSAATATGTQSSTTIPGSSAAAATGTQSSTTISGSSAATVPGTQPAATTATTGQPVVVDGTLPIPPILIPEAQGATKVFRLTAQKGQSQFVAGKTTATYGFNGNYLGPTLRAGLGDRVLIHVTNNLGETTTVHWHGMHLPAAMDGGPHQTVADNTTWTPQFSIHQPAATLWYHPHMMGQTLRQVGMGLTGLFILDDTDPAQSELPHAYGIDDIPLIIQAKTFDANGQFNLNGGGGGGGRGGGGATTTLVNGAISPAINTPASRLRFRLLNASSEEFYNIGFAGGQSFYQVASDGGLLTAPVALTRLQLAPAERAEIVFDVDPATPMMLQSFNGNAGGRGGVTFRTGTLLTINPTQTTAVPTALPATLAAIERLTPASAAQSRQFVLGGDDQNPTINGQAMTTTAEMMDMTNVIQVKLDTTEIWNVINRSNDTHAFHIHDIQFQILQRNGVPPAANESGLKDTVVVHPAETVLLIMRFTDYADPNTPYMYHCHLLNHEDNGMMGQFVVV